MTICSLYILDMLAVRRVWVLGNSKVEYQWMP